MGKYPKNNNEVIINNNLYNYLSEEEDNIINKRINILNNFLNTNELKIVGVINNSIINSELIIYFDYGMIDQLFKDVKIYDYQIDVINIKDIKNIINQLTKSKLYLSKEDIKNDELNFSIEYSEDLDNYDTFYELIRLAKVVIYSFYYYV